MESFLWLMPSAGPAALKTVAQLLKGEVPCPSEKLAAALSKAESTADCQGLLKDDALRQSFGASVKAIGGQVDNSSSGKLVEALGKALSEKLKAIKSSADVVAKALPKESKSGGKIPSFDEVKAAMPKGKDADGLKRDWMCWHSVGHNLFPADLPPIAENVLRERLALAACAGSGPIADAALSMHILENVKAYIAWETSLAGSKSPAKSLQTLCPFDDKMAREVAARRVLMFAGFSTEVASACAAKGADKVEAALKEMAAQESKVTMLPMYVAPPAPKEPKQKGGEGGGKKDKAGAAAPAAAAAGGGAAPAAGSIAKLHGATATQELQWQLLAYQLRPRTTLGAAGPAGKAAAGGARSGSTAQAPQGFAGTWAPVGAATLPPGHTPYSWDHAAPAITEAKFAKTWEPVGEQLPPGHTPYSWEKVLGSSATAGAGASGGAKASSSTAATPKEKGGKAAASPPAPKAANGGPPMAEGSPEAALAKIDIRCGRIKECGRVPDADSLYLLKVDVGEAQPRQVVSSLVKHYKEEELKDRQVMVYCNIKPGKMRGFDSQAMVLAATKDKGADNEKCELIAPPKGAKEGTRPKCGDLEVGSMSEGVSTKSISKVWGQVQPLLVTDDGCKAMFSGQVLSFPEGPITAPSLTGVGIF